MTAIRFALSILTIAAFATCAGAPSHAQSYPSKPIKLIVPFTAGGPMDTMARLTGHHLSEQLGQTVVVDNRGGAGGTIGTKAGLIAEPDGYTLVWASSATLGIAPELYKATNYDPKGLVPVALVTKLPFALAVHPSLPINTVQELVAYAKANPGKVNFAGSIGAPPHLIGALFKARTGVDTVYVPYKGATEGMADLLAGRTHFTFDALSILAPQFAQGKLRPLAVINDSRLPALPDVPTMAESGFKDFDAIPFSGVMAPPGTPKDIVDKLNAAINTGLQTPDAKASLAKFSALTQLGSAQDFAAFAARNAPQWSEMVRISGVAAGQ